MQKMELFECKYLVELYLHYNVQLEFLICIFCMAVTIKDGVAEGSTQGDL